MCQSWLPNTSGKNIQKYLRHPVRRATSQGFSLKTHGNFFMLNALIQRTPRQRPRRFIPKRSRSMWSHQHSQKLGSQCLKVSSMISNPAETIQIIGRSLIIIILNKYPKKWAATCESIVSTKLANLDSSFSGVQSLQSSPQCFSGSGQPRSGAIKAIACLAVSSGWKRINVINIMQSKANPMTNLQQMG